MKAKRAKTLRAGKKSAGRWPKGYVKSFAGIPRDFARPPQGKAERRPKPV